MLKRRSLFKAASAFAAPAPPIAPETAPALIPITWTMTVGGFTTTGTALVSPPLRVTLLEPTT